MNTHSDWPPTTKSLRGGLVYNTNEKVRRQRKYLIHLGVCLFAMAAVH